MGWVAKSITAYNIQDNHEELTKSDQGRKPPAGFCVYVLLLATGALGQLASLVEPLTSVAGGSIAGFLYLVGQTDDPKTSEHVFQYNLETDEWDVLAASLPITGFSYSSEVVDEKLYLIGGVGNSGVQKAVQIFDPSTRAWT